MINLRTYIKVSNSLYYYKVNKLCEYVHKEMEGIFQGLNN